MNDSEILELGKRRAEELRLCRRRVMNDFPETYYYMADDIHRLLGSAKSVFGLSENGDWYPNTAGLDEADKYKALLIGIQRIKTESEERQLLKELAEWNPETPFSSAIVMGISRRAKALLAKGEA